MNALLKPILTAALPGALPMVVLAAHAGSASG